MSKGCNVAYQSVLNYLYTSLPIYQHQGERAIKKMGLEKIREICKELGYPEQHFKSIHIAGTNGKGSTSHALAAILDAAGYKTGLYTSPHLLDFSERIRLNGKAIGKSYVIDFVCKHKALFEKVEASFFEMSVALAFSFFAEQKVDIAVIEVGLGGRLDATNVIMPEVAIITHISLDHTAILGNTLAKIAYEKAGIIKPHRPVIIGEYHQATASVFEAIARARHARLAHASFCYAIELVSNRDNHLVVNVKKEEKDWLKNLVFDGGGLYQLNNIPGVLSAIDLLHKKGFTIQESAIRSGLGNIRQLTGLLGRWHILAHTPRVIADIAHNQAGIKQVVKQLSTLSYDGLHIIFGMVKKPMEEALAMLEVLPHDAVYYFVQAQVPRAMEAEKVADLARSLGLQGLVYENVHEGLAQAKKNTSYHQKDIILIIGSIYIVAEALTKDRF